MPSPDELARTLSDPMRVALRRRQEDLVDDRALVFGHGMTMRALRQRGIIDGAMPRAVVTPFGRAVLAADPSISGEPTR